MAFKMTTDIKIWNGLNDAGRTFYKHQAYHECLCGFTLPVDRQGPECNAQFPNWARLMDHQATCQAVIDDFEKNKVFCTWHRGWVHRNHGGGNPCDRCIEKGE